MQAASRRTSWPVPCVPVTTKIRHYRINDSIFIDNEYLIRGLPGRILVRLLKTYQLERRTEFTNKELRVDAELKLSGYRDNLEARLILLRQRLEQRAAPLRIVKTGRGRFRLMLSAPFELACH